MRLQVMHLPAPPEEYPFALIVDDVKEMSWWTTEQAERLRERIGCRAVLVFPEPVEVL